MHRLFYQDAAVRLLMNVQLAIAQKSTANAFLYCIA